MSSGLDEADKYHPSAGTQKREEFRAQCEQTPPDGGFVPGHTIWFAPDYLRIRLNSGKGWDFTGSSNEPAPPPLQPTPSLSQCKVGINADGITKIHYRSNPVFIRLTTEAAGMEVVESLGYRIEERFIRYDP